MNKTINLLKITIISMVLALVISSCEQLEPTPTHELMQGVWEIDAVYDEEGKNITDEVTTILPAYIHLDDKNSVNSTCGPLFMYIVYGKSRFINVVSRVDEVFDYADLSFTEGEWFIKKSGQTNLFTCEIKMKFPGMNTLESILSDMGNINLGFLDEMIESVIYHKFIDINIDVSDYDPDKMIWRIDDNTKPIYNTKNQYGDYVLWNGVSLDAYTRCEIHWKKQSKSLIDLVNDNFD